MMGSDDTSNNTNLYVFLVGAGSAALVVTIYHCIASRWRNGYYNSPSPQPTQGFIPDILISPSTSNSLAQLIPAHKYQRGVSLVGDDGMCVVCLGEFDEGEELRTLPECKHTYHVSCIDMWLYSHMNCPVCRKDATPSRLGL